MIEREVCYERLRPAQIREAREEFPVAYLPLGTLEWHGPHNPVGLDGLKMHGLCVRCAIDGGGLVFPTMYYGEAREEGLIDSNPKYREGVSKAMGLPPSNFEPGYMRQSPAEAIAAYQRLLLHALNEIQSLGFEVIVLGAGHYPLIDHARAAAHLFHQQRWGGLRREIQPIPWVFTGYELVKDLFPDAGDHAGFWETSLMLALDEPLVDLDEIHGRRDDDIVGIITERPLAEANPVYGLQAVQSIVERVGDHVRDRLDHREKYLGHGLVL